MSPGPESVSRKPLDVIQAKESGIKWIRVLWVDLTNLVRVRVLSIDHFMEMLESPRPNIHMSLAILGLVHLELASGFSSCSDYLYVLDLSSWMPCPHIPGHASVMGWLQHESPQNDSLSVDLCPRGALSRLVSAAKSQLGISFLVGIETEFVLLRSTGPIAPSDYHDDAAARALLAGSDQAKALEEIADAIVNSGIYLELYHPEAAPGQYEIVMGALPPLEAADVIVHIRQIILNVASKHGLHATFAPRVFADSIGSSAHVHVSVTRSGESQKKPGVLSEVETQFLAGVLDHLPAIPAFTMPIPASYARMQDGVWSGGTWVNWGTENREAPVRLCKPFSASRNFEVRIMDGTANPYLGLAAILGAGIHGIRTQTGLNVKDCNGELCAAKLGEDGRNALGVVKRLPLSWEEGRQRMAEDQEMKEVFGENFIEKYLSVNKLLAEQLECSNGGDEAKKLTHLVEFY